MENASIQTRKATDRDIPEIVSLLKVSLGESLMPKSESYWRWKHVENPFGQSPVLVAEIDGKIVGVRAFMRWSWDSVSGRIHAVRAVDTATHPDYQGKGIFNKLTLALLEQSRIDGLDLVYNTPNSKSLPGYLKMGWKQVGKYPLNIRAVRPLSIAHNLLFKQGTDTHGSEDSTVPYFVNHPGMSKLLSLNREVHNRKIISAHTVETLRWRYGNVPVARYYAAGLESGNELKAVFFFRIKMSKAGKELRITDLFGTYDSDIRELRRLLKENIKSNAVDYVTFSGVSDFNLVGGLFNFRLSLGPMVTVRDIQANHWKQFHSFDKWSPSMGDLELF